MKISTLCGTTAALSLAVALATPAAAQGTPAAPEDIATADDTSDTGEDILVTGSRIRRPNLESTVPIASISGETLLQQGNSNIGDTLNELPQLRSTFAQQNPALGVGIAGLNLLDLRGLGTQRTLVLVNGRRHVAADILNNAVSVDINTIPNDLIERVDIVTGGNSAVYGSDAIAGVVNFVLKRDFDGLQLRGNAGISDGGFNSNQYVAAMFGKNFGGGRGNITLHAEYAHQDRVFGSDVPFLQRVDGLGVVDADAPGTLNGSDGNPDRVFFRDVRNSNINRFGLVPVIQPVANPQCGVGVSNGVTPGTPYYCGYVFDAVGNLSPLTGTRYSTGVIGGIAGGNGQTGREDQLLSVLPNQDRYNFNLLAHYEFADALEAFVEAKFVRIDTQGSNASSLGIQGTFGQFDFRERVRLDNPYLSPSARATIASAILASGCNTSINTGCSGASTASSGPLTDAQRAAIADGSYRFVVARNLADVGIRDERFRRDTYRIVGGLRGTFNTDWGYELSVNYGRMEETTDTNGYFDKQRFNLSIDAGRNPATGQIQCRSQYDPTAAVAGPNNAANLAKLAADIAACVPYNPFGQNAGNAAAGAYFSRPYHVDGFTEQFIVSGFVSGDTSGFFNLPGGPVRFAAGAEYRREKAFYAQDDFGASGNSTAVAFGTFEPTPFEVKEAFGEIQIPILKETPFFHELTLSGAARVAQYQGAVGTVWAYNGGVDWAPIEDIRFRANYSRAVRAPNSTETFGELVPNFSTFTDPCAPSQIGAGTQFRAANCQADLGPLLANLASLGTYSLQILSGVNPNLQAETSKSLTFGAVVQPRFIPGLSLSVDYYDITVEDVITPLTAQQIVSGCYDQQSLDNPFCGLFERFRGPGQGPEFNENPGQVLGNSLISAPFNFAQRKRRGIDTQINFRTDLATDTRLSANLIYTHNLQNSNYENPNDPTFENRVLGELGDPVDEFRLDTDLSFGAFTFGYRMRYIGPMWVNAYENYNSLQGRPPQDADYADINQYPETFYHDIRFEWNIGGGGIGRDMQFFAGVDNVLNTPPPLGLAGTGGEGAGNDRNTQAASVSAIYDVRGRNFYAGFKARF